MPKYMMLMWVSGNEDEFMNYIEHIKKEHNMKITIEESETNIYYFGEDEYGNKDLYGIEKKEADQA